MLLLQPPSKRRGLRGAWVVSVVSLGLVLTACGGGGSGSPAPGKPAPKSPAAAPATAPAAKASTPSAHLQTVSIALSNSSPSNAGVYVADGLGYFAQEGIKLSFIKIGGGASAIVPALATNRVQVADVGINPAMLNAVAKGLGIKVVADKGSQPKGFGFTSIVVRKDLANKIKGPADFKGVTVAMTPPGLATANGYSIGIYLAKAGLTPSDIHIQPIAFPLQIAALKSKAVQVAIMAEPFATEAVKTGLGVRLASMDQVTPDQQVAAIAYSGNFIAKHKTLADKFMVAYVKGIRYYDNAFINGANKAKVVQILVKETAVKSAKLWAQMIPAGLNPNGTLNLKSIQAEENYFHKLGVVKKAMPLSSFIDNSFVKYADQKLGPAK